MLKYLMLIIYIVACGYVAWRTIHWAKYVSEFFNKKWICILITAIYYILCSSIIVGKMLPYGDLSRSIISFGNLWFGMFLYIVFFMLIADIIVLICKFALKDKFKDTLHRKRFIYILGMAVIVLSLGFTVYGHYHAADLKVNKLPTISLNKKMDKTYKTVLITDFHMGYSVGIDRMQAMVDAVNKQNADIVIIGGDIFDNEYESLEDADKLCNILKSIKSKYGVYGIYGNHDVKSTLIGGFTVSAFEDAIRDPRFDTFCKKANIKMLEDSSVLVDNEFYLVGRLDGEKAGDGTDNRKTIQTLTAKLDKTKPIIVLNHEPNDFDQAIDSGVDLMLSGHTHAGQFFPLNITCKFKWDNYWGIVKKGNFTSITSSGVGVYGPDMRTMTNSEIMVFDLKGK